ncbi:MAG: hypothetical protein FD189_281 [Elusimicrobia bacterium]|nr:MAG: hypothetical protein FD154_81 [Elusimicrobiota bacterium]KAF0158014.1 MAG: hypothetical protein FD189_281 [Elusimicrobiota bacterium]
MNFSEPFNKTAVLDFLKNQFLPDDFAESREPVKFSQLSLTPDRVKEIEFIGESSSLALKLYMIRHESETDPRVTLSRETFRVMSSLGAQRALVVFYSASSSNYRLSLATITLALKGAKTKREYSNPRRYSFFLGPDAKTHTPEQFLSKKVSDFEDLLGRFSIEVVNKDFYNEIATKFTALVGGKLRLPGRDMSNPASRITAQEFAVRLIGRIVFCWFLKKKKSPGGEPLLPESVLSSVAVAACDKAGDNYYHAVLENFFFQVLNTEIAERATEFKKTPYDKIPFLNGGLFEPHDGDFYDFDALTCCSRLSNTLKIPNEWFKGFFETLETYNFTIDENTSVDVELAVDPEMLGRIFENLLAEINPETGETARKATGSYYTPRPIVEYMVDESLKEYLKTRTAIAEDTLADLLSYSESDTDLSEPEKEKIISALDEVKIIDPACGSGAFPMGMLQKIVLVLQKVDPDSRKWLSKLLDSVPDATARETLRKKLEGEADLWNYTRKLGVIRKSIYGVDIQPIAVEISKLRFFLSLVVDEKVDDKKKNRAIEPLPNLEFKFVCANALIALPEIAEHMIDLFNYNAHEHRESPVELMQKLSEIRDEYFSAYGKKKHAWEKKFRETQLKLSDFASTKGTSRAEMLSKWDPFRNKSTEWFDSNWMFGVKDGFDIVIANPPYVRQEDIKEYKPVFKEQYECFTGASDLYVYFYEQGLKLLRPGGILTFISSNKYFRSGYGEKLRGFLAAKGRIHTLIDFGDAPVFTAIAYPSIILVSKDAPPDGHKTRVFTWDPAAPVEEFSTRLNSGSFYMPQKDLRPDGWRLESPAVLKLLEKLRKAGKPLGEYVNGKFYRGILTGLNEAFVVDRATRDMLITMHKSSAEVLKPFLRGRDVKRWKTEFAEQYLIKLESSENKPHPWSGKPEAEAEKAFAKTYPAIHAHLHKFRAGLIKRDDQGRYFWELRSCVYWQEFEKPKIIYPDIAQGSEFTYDDDKFFLMNTLYLLPTSEKWLLGLLNSKPVFWFYTMTSTQIRGGFVRFIAQYVSQIPVPQMDGHSKRIETLADKILAAKRTNPAADVSALEGEINQHVYKLYNLTPEEIKIVTNTD